MTNGLEDGSWFGGRSAAISHFKGASPVTKLNVPLPRAKSAPISRVARCQDAPGFARAQPAETFSAARSSRGTERRSTSTGEGWRGREGVHAAR